MVQSRRSLQSSRLSRMRYAECGILSFNSVFHTPRSAFVSRLRGQCWPFTKLPLHRSPSKRNAGVLPAVLRASRPQVRFISNLDRVTFRPARCRRYANKPPSLAPCYSPDSHPTKPLRQKLHERSPQSKRFLPHLSQIQFRHLAKLQYPQTPPPNSDRV
jgi:hypothetical protein